MNNRTYFFNDLFDLLFDADQTTTYAHQRLHNIYTEDGIRKMDLELPGYAKDDLEITANANFLTIKTHDKFEESKRRPHFKKEFKLDNTIDIESIQAQMENGILTIVFETSDKNLNIKIK